MARWHEAPADPAASNSSATQAVDAAVNILAARREAGGTDVSAAVGAFLLGDFGAALNLLLPMSSDCPDRDCPADLTGDGSVSTNDLLFLLAVFGQQDCAYSLIGAAVVGTEDLLEMLAQFGSVCVGAG